MHRLLLQLRHRILGIREPRYFVEFVPHFRGKRGIEIGGPSEIFSERGCYPIYPIAAEVDQVVFASATIWDKGFRDRAPGRKIVEEGADLSFEKTGFLYDFVLSSHSLEHMANPLKALVNWKSLLAPNGIFFLVLPDPRYTFDHKRPVTPFEHLLQDYARQVPESDLTHLDEVLQLHDLSMDPDAGSPEEFQARSAQNHTNRCLHHHVFSLASGVRALEHSGYRVLRTDKLYPFHLVFIAQPVG
jgi:SAM-dependent methyltransferase